MGSLGDDYLRFRIFYLCFFLLYGIKVVILHRKIY